MPPVHALLATLHDVALDLLGQPVPLTLVVSGLMVLVMLRFRRPTLGGSVGCRGCQAGYKLNGLPYQACDGRSVYVHCPECDAWYAIARSGRDVLKVAKGAVPAVQSSSTKIADPSPPSA